MGASRKDVALKIEAVTSPEDTLGESPIWSVGEGALYWVDLRAPSVKRLGRDGEVRVWPMPALVGAVLLRRSGGLVVGLPDGLHAFSPETGLGARLVAVDEGCPENRVNDSRCDQAGRIWFGTMWDFGRRTTGSLYRVDADLTLTRMVGDLTIPNGVCASPDGGRIYLADTRVGGIDVLEGEGVWARRPFSPPGVVPGAPDGATVDAEGHLWNARFGGGLLVRFRPDGGVERTVPLPVSRPTSCSFGGPDLGTLYVTTARQGLSEAELAAEPLAGAVLALRPGVRGLTEPAFAG